MDIVVDTSAIIAVLLDEPHREALISTTRGDDLIAPHSLHWEVGNALAAMFKRRYLDLSQARSALDEYDNMLIRFVEVDLVAAIEIASHHRIYAYDAYMLACALRYNSPLLTLDGGLASAAQTAGVAVKEVT